jgi:phosphate starvation-inducible protein PhoH
VTETEAPLLRTRRADLHGRTPNQTVYLRNIQEHDITFGIGPAGTGKTYLAMAMAVNGLITRAYNRVRFGKEQLSTIELREIDRILATLDDPTDGVVR